MFNLLETQIKAAAKPRTLTLCAEDGDETLELDEDIAERCAAIAFRADCEPEDVAGLLVRLQVYGKDAIKTDLDIEIFRAIKVGDKVDVLSPDGSLMETLSETTGRLVQAIACRARCTLDAVLEYMVGGVIDGRVDLRDLLDVEERALAA